MFIGFRDMHGNYIINIDNIQAVEESKYVTSDYYGIDITMTSGVRLDLQWKNETDRNKMMSYLYGQLVQPKLKMGEPNRFFDATE